MFTNIVKPLEIQIVLKPPEKIRKYVFCYVGELIL